MNRSNYAWTFEALEPHVASGHHIEAITVDHCRRIVEFHCAGEDLDPWQEGSEPKDRAHVFTKADVDMEYEDYEENDRWWLPAVGYTAMMLLAIVVVAILLGMVP